MARQRGLRYWTRSIFNVPRWVGWNEIKRNAENIQSLYRSFFTSKPVSLYRETFEQAIERMGLTEHSLVVIQKNYFTRSLFYGLMLLLCLLYHCYLCVGHHWSAAIVMFSIDFMLFSFFFREEEAGKNLVLGILKLIETYLGFLSLPSAILFSFSRRISFAVFCFSILKLFK